MSHSTRIKLTAAAISFTENAFRFGIGVYIFKIFSLHMHGSKYLAKEGSVTDVVGQKLRHYLPMQSVSFRMNVATKRVPGLQLALIKQMFSAKHLLVFHNRMCQNPSVVLEVKEEGCNLWLKK